MKSPEFREEGRVNGRDNRGRRRPRGRDSKKILEWEDKEKKTEWRGAIADRYSIT